MQGKPEDTQDIGELNTRAHPPNPPPYLTYPPLALLR